MLFLAMFVDKYHVRKYGAHGTSHRYIWRATNEFTNGQTHKLVSCHLGSGASLSAIEDGRDLETTMALLHLMALSWALAAALLTQLPFLSLSRWRLLHR